MRLAGRSEYTVIVFSNRAVSVCRFRKSASRFRVMAFARADVAGSDTAAALRTVLKETGGVSGCVILSGELSGGEFFRCPALELPGVREQREALEFELPRRMLHVPDDPVIQFVPAGQGDDPQWNVYAFPGNSFLSLSALLGSCRSKADEFIHPLLAVRGSDPDVVLPVLEEKYVFSKGQWRPGTDMSESDGEFWKKEFDRLFLFPKNGFVCGEYTECLLVMRFLADPDFRTSERSVRILPAKLRPKRLRFHAAVSVLLLLALLCIHAKDVVSERASRFKEYKTLTQERDNYRRKTANLKSVLKKSEKENKEMQRILLLNAGCRNLLGCFADLGEALPSDAMVSNLRFNEMTADLMIQSESETMNLPQSLKGLSYWKIGQLQQRSMNGTVTMTMLKLVPAEDEK